MTYGSYALSNGVRSKKCHGYDATTITKSSFRQKRWLASHLKTFKYKLWKRLNMDVFFISNKEVKQALIRALLKFKIRHWYHWKSIKAKDLLESSGEFIRRIDDKVFTFPMLEMSGDKAVFIGDILYVYRSERAPYAGDEKNYGEEKSEKWHTRLIRDVLIHKEKYNRLTKL